MAREYFCAYHSYLQSMKQLSDAEVGRLFRAMLRYSETGELDKLYGNERFVADTIVAQIDRDKQQYAKKCATNRENGAKGGLANAPERGAKATERPRTPPKEKEKEKKKEKKKENGISPDGDICAEPRGGSTPDNPPVILLPLNDGSDFGVTDQMLSEFSGLYPAVDVMQELRNMRGWLLNNVKNRKTRSGICRFINSWLSREQDRPKTRSAKASVPYGATGELGEAELAAIQRVLRE